MPRTPYDRWHSVKNRFIFFFKNQNRKFKTNTTMSAGLRIFCVSFKNGGPVFDTKLHLIVRFQFWKSRKCEVLLILLLLPRPHRPFRIPSSGQIYWYSIEESKKKTFKNNNTKMKIGAYNENNSITSRQKITLNRLSCR